ncbi:MAG TPA: choice-of-anchor Q domain-containing protein [Ktedonobacterales bacterium]
MSTRTRDTAASGVKGGPQGATTDHPSTGGSEKRRRGPRAWRMAFTALTAIVLSVASLAAMPLGAAHAAASELSVTKCKAYGGSDQGGTLGDALAQAARTSGSAITFACAGIGPFMILVPTKILVSNTLTISSPARNVTLDGGKSTRIFEVQTTGNLTLEGITVAHGQDRIGGGAYIWGPGKLTIQDSIFYDNSVQNVSGDLNHPTGADSYGGGVYNNGGTLTITDSTFSNNATTGGKGYGGAVYSSGALTIDHSAFRANRASGGEASNARGGGYGGAVYSSGALTIDHSAFRANRADDGGGVYNNGTATITNTTISGNTAGSRGGGVYNSSAATITITNTTIGSNQSGVYGGGVFNDDGTMSITNSGLLANFAGGGDFSGYGGGVYSAGATPSAMVTIANSTLSGNWAFGGSGTWQGYGGGIFSGSNTRLSVTNSTFSDNVVGMSKTVQIADPYVRNAVSAATQVHFGVDFGGFLADHDYTSTGYGGGVHNDGTATIINSTFSGNLAVGSGGSGGGVNNSTRGSMTIKNSIVAGNTANTSGAANCGGTITNGGYNLMNTVGECGSTPDKHDVRTSDPKLDSLADYGGPTLTLALLKDSLAIDRIPRGTNGCGTDITTDQRGLTRPQGAKCDIGTFELDNAPPTTTASVSPKPNASGVYTADVKVTLSGGNDGGGSGVKATYYKLDNGGQQTYTAPLSITSNGKHTLTYWSVDKVGNEEVARMLTITLDKTGPTPPILSLPPIVYIGAGLAGLVIVALIVALLIGRRKPGAGAATIGEPSEAPRTPVMR